jgi:hypothetical protein
MFAQDESDRKRPARVPCAKVVAAVFGALFLIALLAVPVTTTTSRLRQDQGSNIVTRTTYPRKATVFLPQYLSMRAHPRQGRTVELRATQWTATMGIIAILGIFDYFVFCRVLRRVRRPEEDRS